MQPQVSVLDAGGQYCHLITRKIRELGVSAEVRPSDSPASELNRRKAIVISGGPSSVYEPSSPQIDPAILTGPAPVLGICYGQQLIAHLLGGKVEPGDKGEYGLARLDVTRSEGPLYGVASGQTVWMSHRDTVAAVPPGFSVLGSTSTCTIAAIGNAERKLYGVQFHPEVVHTAPGKQILSNFLFEVAGCSRDWSPAHQIDDLETAIREVARDRNVFFFVSGGVDSTVAYTLCLRALGPDRVQGIYVDTGLMREGETAFVREVFQNMGSKSFLIEDASASFLAALKGVTEPEKKRHIIGEEFVEVQDRILQSGHFLDGHWILGQGTIYPDTIESGGTAKADVIKTHHNRVAGIQKLIESNRIIEPLSSFYKDEVREIGRQLNLPGELLDRHPFPGPGLAIRCLCSNIAASLQPLDAGWLVPVHSVGVQGDSRSYRPVLALEHFPDDEESAELVNRIRSVNRVMALAASHVSMADLAVSPAFLDAARLERLRRADAVVRRLSHDSGFDREVWQFPVILIPVGAAGRPDSVVLRPIQSIDGMTAKAVRMNAGLLEAMSKELLGIEGVAAVFYDLTHKPPGTIEWE